MNDEYVLLDDTALTDDERADLDAFLNEQPGFGGIKFRKRAHDSAALGALANSLTTNKVMVISAGLALGKAAGEIAKALIQDWLKKRLVDKSERPAEEIPKVLLYDHNGDAIVSIRKPR